MNDYLESTPILDFDHPQIQSLIDRRHWLQMDAYHRIGAAYDFVRNDIRFGYNASDDLRASEVLRDGYGQCNTKGNLLMALLRVLGIPCRFHGFTIHADLQKGAIPVFLYWLAPDRILHSWVEVQWQDRWVNLEGFILDDAYLTGVQEKFSECTGSFSGYGVATSCLAAPNIEWTGVDTYIQKEGIADDFGVFDSPDAFYVLHGTNLRGVRRFFYQHVARHMMNVTVNRIRCGRQRRPLIPKAE